MLDYTLLKKNKEYFITKFEESGDTITVYYANGITDVIPNNKENLNTLNEMLWSQARNGKPIVREFIFLLSSLLCVGATGKVVHNVLTTDPMLIEQATLSLISILSLLTSLKQVTLVEDMKKNRFFVNNSETIRSAFAFEDELKRRNAFVKVSKKGTKVVNSIQVEPCVTLNEIDDLSLSDLKRISSNIKRHCKNNFDYGRPNENLDGPTLTKEQ